MPRGSSQVPGSVLLALERDPKRHPCRAKTRLSERLEETAPTGAETVLSRCPHCPAAAGSRGRVGDLPAGGGTRPGASVEASRPRRFGSFGAGPLLLPSNARLSASQAAVLPTFALVLSPPRLTSAHPTLQPSWGGLPAPPAPPHTAGSCYRKASDVYQSSAFSLLWRRRVLKGPS